MQSAVFELEMPMPRVKRSIQVATTIEGFSLIWHLHREQHLDASDGPMGISIHVKVEHGVFRELALEYPAVRSQKSAFTRTEPGRPTILAAKVEAHIRQAMAAGWNPGSRGKPFVYQVAELPS